MYSVEIDKSKRLIVISAVGHVTTREVREAAQKVREIVKDTAPGFRVLIRFSVAGLDAGFGFEHVAEIMDAVAAKKVGFVARVIPDPRKDIGLNILSHFHYGPEIQTATFETLADALQSLAESSGV